MPSRKTKKFQKKAKLSIEMPLTSNEERGTEESRTLEIDPNESVVINVESGPAVEFDVVEDDDADVDGGRADVVEEILYSGSRQSLVGSDHVQTKPGDKELDSSVEDESSIRLSSNITVVEYPVARAVDDAGVILITNAEVS